MRLFPDMVKQYFILLAYLKFRIGGDFHSVYTDLYNYYKEGRVKDPLIVRALQMCKLEHLDPKHSLDELLELLKNNLAYPGNSAAEGDLIDILIEALNSPYAHNLLTGKTVKSLRKSLMQPEELVAFKDRIRKNKVGCAGCGIEFEERESISFSTNDGQIALYCSLCLVPTTAACPGCKKKAPFSERFTTKKWKDCSSHNGKEPIDKDAPVPKNPDVNWAQRVLLNNREARRREAPFRVRAAAPQPPPAIQFYGPGEAGNVGQQAPPQDVYNYVYQADLDQLNPVPNQADVEVGPNDGFLPQIEEY